MTAKDIATASYRRHLAQVRQALCSPGGWAALPRLLDELDGARRGAQHACREAEAVWVERFVTAEGAGRRALGEAAAQQRLIREPPRAAEARFVQAIAADNKTKRRGERGRREAGDRGERARRGPARADGLDPRSA